MYNETTENVKVRETPPNLFMKIEMIPGIFGKRS